MNKYYLEIMRNGYVWESKIEFSAVDDSAAFVRACELVDQRSGCIAFSVSRRVGRKTVYITGA